MDAFVYHADCTPDADFDFPFPEPPAAMDGDEFPTWVRESYPTPAADTTPVAFPVPADRPFAGPARFMRCGMPA